MGGVPSRVWKAVAATAALLAAAGGALGVATHIDPAAASAGETVTAAASAAPAPATPPVVRLPPVDGRVDYQLGGAYPPLASVTTVTRDRTAAPVPGRYSICYVNAFQTQPGERAFWLQHRDLLVQRHGQPVTDPDWPGEYVLDVSTAAKRRALAAIVLPWIDGCAASGFQAVEPDNLDTYTRFTRITRADALAWARLLIARAHERGLAIAQKNTVELAGAGKRIGFDFAVAEECQAHRECAGYTRVYGRQVLEIEYTDGPRSAFRKACAARGDRIPVILRDRDVVPRGAPGYRSRAC